MLINNLRRTDCISGNTFTKIKKAILPFGMLTLASAIILDRFVPENGPLAFFTGFLMGISIVANIAGIIIISLNWKKNKK